MSSFTMQLAKKMSGQSLSKRENLKPRVNPAYGRGGKSSNILTPEGTRMFVRKSLQVLVKAAEHFGFDSSGVKMSGFFRHHEKCALLIGDPVKYMKYKLSAYFAAQMADGLELPPEPPALNGVDKMPGELFGGRLYKWIKMKFQDLTFRRAWCTTVLYSKGGMPRPDKAYLKLKEREAFQKLTSPVSQPSKTLLDPRAWGEDEDEDEQRRFIRPLERMCPSIRFGLVTETDFCTQISRTAEELFSGNPFTEAKQNRMFFPSTSANYINSRARGGAIGYLKTNLSDVIEDLKFIHPGKSPIRVDRFHTSSRSTMSVSYPVIDTSVLQARWSSFIHSVGLRAMSEIPVAKPLGLLESLKIRVITKGPPLLNTYLKPLQMHLWNVMHRHPAFQLTGTPVNEWIIQERMGANLKSGQSFVSVDYEDATNGLFSSYSLCAVKAISKAVCLDDDGIIKKTELFERSLVGHLIEDESGVQKKQTRGQLMGSITSFVVLCVINAAILRWVKELDENRIFTLRDSGILVNGDDGLLKLSPQGFRFWQQISAFCGLKPSVGKVYQSNEFCNINSTNYVYDRRGHNREFVRADGTKVDRLCHFSATPFLRMSLYYGLQRSSGVVQSGSNLSSLGAQARDLIAGCPSFIQSSVLRGWMSNHSKTLHSLGRPWFIPEWLGGLGLPVLADPDPLFHTIDKWRRVARKIHDHPERFRTPTAPPASGWQAWALARSHTSLLSPEKSPLEARLASEMAGNSLPARFVSSTGALLTNAAIVNAFLTKTLDELFPENPGRIEGSVMAKVRGKFREVLPTTILQNYSNRWRKLYHDALCDNKIPLPEPYAEANFPLPPVKVYDDVLLMYKDTIDLQAKLPDDFVLNTDEVIPFSFDSSVRAAQLLRNDDWW
jgi:hypothetical protein